MQSLLIEQQRMEVLLIHLRVEAALTWIPIRWWRDRCCRAIAGDVEFFIEIDSIAARHQEKVAAVLRHELSQNVWAGALVEEDFIKVTHLADVFVLVEEHVLMPWHLLEEDLKISKMFNRILLLLFLRVYDARSCHNTFWVLFCLNLFYGFRFFKLRLIFLQYSRLVRSNLDFLLKSSFHCVLVYSDLRWRDNDLRILSYVIFAAVNLIIMRVHCLNINRKRFFINYYKSYPSLKMQKTSNLFKIGLCQVKDHPD